MNKPYIKNKGTTTFITSGTNPDCPSGDSYNKVDWDIDYNGKIANVELNVNTDGRSKYLNYELTNDDLANILNIPAFNMPLEQRLKVDFPLNNQEFIAPPQNILHHDQDHHHHQHQQRQQELLMSIPQEEDIDLEESDLDDIFLPEKITIPDYDPSSTSSLTMSSIPTLNSLPPTMSTTPLLDPELSSLPSLNSIHSLDSLSSPELQPLPVFEQLIQPLQVDKVPSKKRRFTHKRPPTPHPHPHSQPHHQKRHTRRRPVSHHTSSLRRKLMTPRPKTMRILLKPKTHSSSSRHRHHQPVHPDHPNIHKYHKKTHRNTSWLSKHPNSWHIYTPTGH
jgi:hypothetical protein